MRIVGGKLGGRRFPGPPGNVTRPTSERVREAIASALDARDALAGRKVLDLYAGTGALGFEALSRGASSVTFVERDARVASALRTSAESLGVTDAVDILREDITRERGQRAILARAPFSLVFADPPYAELTSALSAVSTLCEGGLLADDAILLLEHAAKQTVDLPQSFLTVSSYRYGDTAVTLLALGDDRR
jgi:16S rRNA (guanine966-N2)-methyltransferase